VTRRRGWLSLAGVVAGLVAVGAAVLLLGPLRLVVTHGVSMNPVYYQGDLVIVAAADRYSTGEIVAYHDRVHHLVVLHRIIGGDPTGYEFQGDNNQSVDAVQPRQADLIGRALLHLPKAGAWLDRMTGPVPLGVAAFLLLAAGGTATQTRRAHRSKRRGTVAQHARLGTRSAAHGWLLPHLVTVAAAAAVVAVFGAALGLLAFTGPTTMTTTEKSPTGRQVTFSYSAHVVRSPAYDGTTVTSPDPVFRALANGVQVAFAYRGAPGSVAVDAELSTPSGWHSVLPLARSVTYRGDRYTGRVLLDLPALERRAQQAARVIGAPADSLTVRVRPRFRSTEGAVFAPEMSLTLTPLQLALVPPATLTVKDPATVLTTTIVARHLGLLSHQIQVSTARTAALVLLAGGLLAIAAIAVLGQMSAAPSEGAAIRRRYAALLAPVHPMPTPPDRPVVEVTDFATLAKLAERYGLLVLHWSRSGVETFVVQDEGATFRYRSGSNSAAVTTGTADEKTPAAPVGSLDGGVREPEPRGAPRPITSASRDILPFNDRGEV
jgi:signal peptidase I